MTRRLAIRDNGRISDAWTEDDVVSALLRRPSAQARIRVELRERGLSSACVECLTTGSVTLEVDEGGGRGWVRFSEGPGVRGCDGCPARRL